MSVKDVTVDVEGVPDEIPDERSDAPGDPEKPEKRLSKTSLESVQSETFKTISRLPSNRATNRASTSSGRTSSMMRPSFRSQAQGPAGATEVEVEGSRGWCCCRRRVPPWQQTIVVLRHSERLDRVDPNYGNTPEGLAWPKDCPITENGVKLAAEVAEELAALQAGFVAIACSPYRRCLETAAQVAKRLNIPVVLDQEIGEVRDTNMPKERAHRPQEEVTAIARSLGMNLLNPESEDGNGVKIFGREPVWPETLEDAKRRFVIRIETYIKQSEVMKHNMIIVTHADAVAAALEMFERGAADIENMEFCGRVIARRKFDAAHMKDKEHGIFGQHWDVDYKGVGAEIFHDKGMEKYYEKMYLESCDETEIAFNERRNMRTKTDMCFEDTLKTLDKNLARTGTGLSKVSERSEGGHV